jgi:hypothetical protein
MISWLLTLVTSLVMLQPELPARDQPKPQKRTAVVRGVVVDAHTGTPLPRAFVELGGSNGQGSAYTDGEGRFEIQELAAGTYRLTASRTPYLFTWYGQQTPNSSGKPIVIREAEVIDKIRVPMLRGGVISGHVVDEYGHPAVGVQVHALQYRYQNGARRLTQISGFGARTDDLGAFRLYALSPGQYYVSAEPASRSRFPPGPAERVGAIITYYPNASGPAVAQRVSVAAGQEVTGLVIGLVTGRLARLRGRALMSSGEPFAPAWVNLVPQDLTGGQSAPGGPVRQDGTFEVSGVPAGHYVLTARLSTAGPDTEAEEGRTPIVVTGDDIDDIVVTGSRGATVRGSLVTDEGVPVPLKPAQWTVVAMTSPDDRGASFRSASINEDYSFELKGVRGRVRISAGSMSAGPEPAQSEWAMKAVLYRGSEIGDRFIEFEPSQVTDGVEIVLSRRWAELSGTVTNAQGEIVPDSWLVVFPSDESRWTAQSRFIQPVRSTAEGTYRARRLMAGDYLIAVVPQFEFGQHEDPDWLRTLAETATPVSIADGEQKTLNLRIASSPQDQY